MQRTRIDRLRSGLERLGDDDVRRTIRDGKSPARFVDLRECDAGRNAEIEILLSAGDREHVSRPDRHGSFSAGEADRRVVIEADPRQRQCLRCEPDEPRIAFVVGRIGVRAYDLFGHVPLILFRLSDVLLLEAPLGK